MIKINGIEHKWNPCPDGCPSDLYCQKCECGDYSCDVLLAYEEGLEAGYVKAIDDAASGDFR